MTSYEHYYNITLLDDLHNYFPDILYGDRSRFRNINDLLEYIRSETRNRFDLFSNAQRRLRQSDTDHNEHTDNTRGDQIRITFNTEDIMSTNDQTPSLAAITGSLMNLVNLLYPTNDINTVRYTNNLTPVLVCPTQEQITNATSIVELPNNTEICSICQHIMTDSQQLRRINHCRHNFHNNCIATHFSSNVRCPNCRYDIRTQTQTQTQTQPS